MAKVFRSASWRWACALVLAAFLLFLGLPQAQAAAKVLPTTVTEASEGCALLGVQGTY